jgi:Uma2 family endonuclease
VRRDAVSFDKFHPAAMLPILELPTVRRLASPISVELYQQMGERAPSGRRMELIRGVIVEKIPSSPLHSLLVGQFNELAQAACGPNSHVRQEQPLSLIDSMPEPDVAAVAGSREDYRRAHPSTALLAIEIAVTFEELDRAKAAIYAEAGVQEYWIVLAERAQIEAHTFPREGSYTQLRRYSRGETLVSLALPTLSVELETLFRA